MIAKPPSPSGSLLAAANNEPPHTTDHGAAHETAAALVQTAEMHPVLLFCVGLALIGLLLGLGLCFYRLVRGPHLADRVLAADLLSLHVVGLVVVLTLYLRSSVFFDAALAVGILGFVSTVGFAQYLHAVAGSPRHGHDAGAPTAPPA